MAIDAAYAKHHAATSQILATGVVLHLQRSDAAAGIRGDSAVVKTLIHCGQHKQLRQWGELQLAVALNKKLASHKVEIKDLAKQITDTEDRLMIFNRALAIERESRLLAAMLDHLHGDKP